jgi:hypothetical protein
MKGYRAIYEEMQRNTEFIEAAKADIDKLSLKEERAAVKFNKANMETLKALRATAEQNAGKIAELSDKIYFLQVVNLVLSDNLKAAIVAEALPVIREAFQKYEGKQYGPKTAAAIKEEIKNAGFFAHVSSDGSDLYINVVNPENMCNDYRFPDVKLYTSYNNRILTASNKISFATAEIVTPAYIEDYTGRAAAIIAAYNKYYEAREAATKARDELNNIMPAGRYYNGDETLYKTIF